MGAEEPASTGMDEPDSRAPALLVWYAQHKRDLPWRRDRNPYRVLVAEFMLQQTQAERVAPRYAAFLTQFPDFAALAHADVGTVLRAWSGLGYNRRALRLHAIARSVMSEYGGELPDDMDQLLSLPGVGRYTAQAVRCFAFRRQVATVDTNIHRVLQRVMVGGERSSPLTDAETWRLAEALLPADQAIAWNEAIMDLGATICMARTPQCELCPLAPHCRARQAEQDDNTPVVTPRSATPRRQAAAQPFVGSSRYYRGRIVRALVATPPGDAISLAALGSRIKEDFTPYDTAWLDGIVAGLAGDGLVSIQRDGGEITIRLPQEGQHDPKPM